MGPLIWATCGALKDQVELRLIVPEHFPFQTDEFEIRRLPTANGKLRRALNMINPLTHLRLWDAISSFRPDLVHIFNSEGYPWSASVSLGCAYKRLPLVVTIHDPKAHPGSALAWLNQRLGSITATRSSLIHLFYDGFRTMVEKAYGRPVFLADYADISDFYLKHRVDGIPREDCILQFGRLEYYKGIDLLVDAARFLPPHVRIIIAGAGSLDDDVRKAVGSGGDRFEIHERFITDAETAAFFQRAKVLVLPYREVTQSLLPAIAAKFGVVTVASDLGFFRDEVPPLGGILVEPDEPEALARALEQALSLEPVLPGNSAIEIGAQYARMYATAIKGARAC